MYLQFKNFRTTNEVLYALSAVDKYAATPVSKIGLQKILYLATSFAPIREIILSVLRYTRWKKGPYSYLVQNTVDQLVAYGLADVSDFQMINHKSALASYQITTGGQSAVQRLRMYAEENDKAWWIDCVTKLVVIYSKEELLSADETYDGIDKIVRLVYMDKSFRKVHEHYGASIDLKDEEGDTHKVISFVKEFLASDQKFQNIEEKVLAELILLAFFEQLYAQYYLQKQHGRG